MSINVPIFGLPSLSLTPRSPWQSGSATRGAQRNSESQLTFKHFSTGWHLCPLTHPWITTGAPCPSSAKWLAMISLDLREAFYINPDCATAALWIKRGFYFPELSIWYFSMLNKFTFSINKKITKKEDDKLQGDLSLEISGHFSFPSEGSRHTATASFSKLLWKSHFDTKMMFPNVCFAHWRIHPHLSLLLDRKGTINYSSPKSK